MSEDSVKLVLKFYYTLIFLTFGRKIIKGYDFYKEEEQEIIEDLKNYRL